MKPLRSSVAGFSIAMVLVYLSIAAGIGYALSIYLGNVTKTYKASEVEQIISLYTTNIQRALTHAEACTKTFNPNGDFSNPAAPVLDPSDGLVDSPGSLEIPRIVNTTVPDLCGALPCNILSEEMNAGSGTVDLSKQIRVKNIRIDDFSGTPQAAGCDPSRPTDACATVGLSIWFAKLNSMSITSVIKRSFRVSVRIAPTSPFNTRYCFSMVDRDYADQDLFVNKGGDTMTGALTIDLDGVPVTPTRALYVKDGYVQTNLFYIDSDRRLKKNIEAIHDPFAILSGIHGREFEWRSHAGKDYGFIAQEVEKTQPQLVMTDPQTQLKSLRYTSLIPVATEAIKQLQQENENLKAEISRANKILDELEKKSAVSADKGNK